MVEMEAEIFDDRALPGVIPVLRSKEFQLSIQF